MTTAETPKIVSARRAALDLVDQFARYADEHQGEPVLLGIYEFSDRNGQPDAREVIPMGRRIAARADAAINAMKPSGGTPIGDAMIAGKRALDATGLSRRHLLVITDGENTNGPDPDDVAAAIERRPESSGRRSISSRSTSTRAASTASATPAASCSKPPTRGPQRHAGLAAARARS